MLNLKVILFKMYLIIYLYTDHKVSKVNNYVLHSCKMSSIGIAHIIIYLVCKIKGIIISL